ncbi:conserved fungal protein [Sugiyamaella lignohabitans]|uniref:Conserved fungal protein n=1 Tax=Sugiyamaella lignohabitans TaxID=796027 RepID=A0A161HFW7_9ASCO|nr:uncharacterized protein AWJ20_4348 [Sugiyamaella lignohabitans]ANB11531.1 conserved fungal protein [Sugiyamaella lignohabitans]
MAPDTETGSEKDRFDDAGDLGTVQDDSDSTDPGSIHESASPDGHESQLESLETGLDEDVGQLGTASGGWGSAPDPVAPASQEFAGTVDENDKLDQPPATEELQYELRSNSENEHELNENEALEDENDNHKTTEDPADDQSSAIPETLDVPVEDSEPQEEPQEDNDNIAEDDDFGEFDDFDEFDEFEEAQPAESDELDLADDGFDPPPASTESPLPAPSTSETTPAGTINHIPCLSETDFSNSAQLQASVLSTLKAMWKSSEEQSQTNASISHLQRSITIERTPTPSSERSYQYHVTEPGSYFSERSASLWQQLVVDGPHMHPTDWKKSSIRRLLLVSLGIPLDLDEILPNKNTKRLVLPNTPRKSNHTDSKKSPAKAGSGPGPTNTTTSTTPEGKSNDVSSRDKKSDDEKEALRQDTQIKLAAWHQLSTVTSEALDGMNEPELQTHVSTLQKALIEAQAMSTQWQQLLQAASQDKETFEGVIESLLEYAQRLRTRSK